MAGGWQGVPGAGNACTKWEGGTESGREGGRGRGNHSGVQTCMKLTRKESQQRNGVFSREKHSAR